ncbi:MAG: hypothetical protein M3P41_16595, partial [Actinomycetota bacterium]|nr:hypothetical protein [Actinomycetota bacterium]
WGQVTGLPGRPGAARRQDAPGREPAELQEKRRLMRPSEVALNGKEGVDGSSPSEGLKDLQNGYFCCLIR